MWHEIKTLILQNHYFLLTTHVNPDGDGVGAACAFAELLLQMGKKVKVLTDGPIPSKFGFLDFHGLYEVFDAEKSYEEAQVLVVLDTHRKDRIGQLAQLLQNPKLLCICIDHHEATEIFTPYTAVDAKACSAGAMVHSFYKECGFNLTLQAAMGIYSSVICDTGRFSYSSTDCKAHKIADECIKMGVDPDQMYSRLFQHVSLAEIKMFANALQHMETHLNNRVIIQQIFQRDYHNLDGVNLDIEHIDLEYFHDFNKMIEDVECIVLLRELPGEFVRVSLRSTSDLDVDPIVKVMGGGGHRKAAGVTCRGALGEIKAEILGLLKELFERRGEVVNKNA